MHGTHRIAFAFLCLTLFSGCSVLFGSHEQVRSGESSSLVDYLYPDGEIPPPVSDQLPALELPLRVGIAFVPSSRWGGLGGAEKRVLMERVADAFRERPYISSIETIPEQYLKSTRGIVGMRQVAAMFGVDVMALVSYDQVSFSGERESALLYWTIVGTTFIKGNSNEVRTLIDTAVFDVNTAALLFRAPGTHAGQVNSTLFDSARDLRNLKGEGFTAANEDMIVNLNRELGHFEEEVKAGESATVAWTDGSGGGGSSDTIFLLVLMGLAFIAVCRKGRNDL